MKIHHNILSYPANKPENGSENTPPPAKVAESITLSSPAAFFLSTCAAVQGSDTVYFQQTCCSFC